MPYQGVSLGVRARLNMAGDSNLPDLSASMNLRMSFALVERDIGIALAREVLEIGEARARHAGGREDVLLDIVVIALAAHPLDDGSEKEEPVVRIFHPRARRKAWRAISVEGDDVGDRSRFRPVIPVAARQDAHVAGAPAMLQ